MSDKEIWPAVSDVRLLRVLQYQVSGALDNLRQCTDDGLGRLAQAMELHPRSEVAPHIMEALTDLQKIDRASQRLQNVVDSLCEWSEATEEHEHETPGWRGVIAARFVMPEECTALSKVLGESVE